jgi:small subunit ribosomal protein S8
MNSALDFIIRIKNATLAGRKEVIIPYSNLSKEIGKVLVKEGFLESIKEETVKGKRNLKVIVKYEKRLPVLTEVEIISKPSLRIYKDAKGIFEIERRGKKTVIVSTNQGVMTGKQARSKGIGGEVIFSIW